MALTKALCAKAILLAFVSGLSPITHDKFELGKPILFRCTINKTENLKSVKWYRHYDLVFNHTVVNNKNSENHIYNSTVRDKESNIWISPGHFITATLKFKIRTIDDAGCLTCAFFFKKKISAISCTAVYMRPIINLHYRYLKNYLDVTCSVTSYPKPLVAILFLDKIYRHDSPVVRENFNGSQTITLSFIFNRQKDTFIGKSITCLSYGGELDENVTVKIKTNEYISNGTVLNEEAIKQPEFEENDLTWTIPIITCVFIFVLVTLTLLCKLGFTDTN
ncbi:membrane glycoprotein UL119 [macacine betaherpesvirus 9]|uniref:Membrane glycoprotein UL119 n=1 Tax=macacine betaherpesvirus 9 TaxID=2560568 RepID=A0A191S3V5_9BETA|nr:membrane glycoprotein UL119 [macacine betaherpesvirus 9]ANC96574.1 membrane glycoprotein UL119 [macacine betaherpesvirus 9]